MYVCMYAYIYIYIHTHIMRWGSRSWLLASHRLLLPRCAHVTWQHQHCPRLDSLSWLAGIATRSLDQGFEVGWRSQRQWCELVSLSRVLWHDRYDDNGDGYGALTCHAYREVGILLDQCCLIPWARWHCKLSSCIVASNNLLSGANTSGWVSKPFCTHRWI